MANVIKHKRGSGSDPAANNLVVGELAIRTDTGKLFTKMDSGAIAEIAGGGSDIAINTLSASSGSGGNNSGVFDNSATRFTLSSPPNVSAAQLLVSVNGVIQKPVLGTGTPSEGFSIDGNDIIFSSPPATGADFFILTFRSLGVSEPADNSVTSAKIVDGAIVNADINASAAIAGTKISPDFGSQNIVTTGGLTVDTTTLKVDASNNRVGIGTASPDTLLHLSGEDTAVIRLENTDTTLGTDQIIGGIEFEKQDATGAGVGIAGAVRLKSMSSVGQAASMFFSTSNSSGNDQTRVTLDFDGKVGIGTTSPEDLLHIKSGKIRIENTIVSNNDSTISYDNTDFIIDVDPNNARGSSKFQVKVDNVAGLTVDDNRNVNIGDTQMSQNLLNIEDGTAAVIDIASHGSGGDTAYIGVKKSTGGGLTFGISNRDIIFKTGATYNNGTSFNSGTERLRITSTGDATFSRNLILEGGSNHAYPFIRLHSSAANVRKWTIYNGQSWNPDALLIYDSDEDNTTLTIETNKLGINRGANSITKTLEVGGNAEIMGFLNVTTGIHIPDGGDNDNSITIGSSNDFRLFHDGSNSFIKDGGTGSLKILSNQVQIINAANSENIANFNQDGAVQLFHNNDIRYTTAAGYGVHYGHFSSNANGSHDLGFSGSRWRNIYYSGSVTTSDKNEKNTITKSDLGLDFIKKLNPVSFKWNKETLDDKTHYGLIAQEVEETILNMGKKLEDFGAVDKPTTQEEGKDYAVTKDESTNMGLNYTELIAPLIKAVQELTAKVEALEAK